MITEPTVLVLGAGVSKSYGFSLGRDLKFEVLAIGDGWARLIKNAKRPDRAKPQNVPSAFYILDKPSGHGKKMLTFAEALRGSQLNSVDRFLETNPDYLLTGKVAIAQVLIAKERLKELMPSPREERIYEFLWNRIWTKKPEDLANNKLSIVTFNYDRSLEYALFTAIRNSYPNVDDVIASQLLSTIRIIHVYGQLGRPEFERLRGEQKGAYYRPYDTEDSSLALTACVNEIKLVAERQGDSEEFAKARELLKQAKRIAFLGFGFDETNMERLGKDRSKGNSSTSIYGTIYNLGDDEARAAEKLIFDYQAEHIRDYAPHLVRCDALQFLRDKPILR